MHRKFVLTACRCSRPPAPTNASVSVQAMDSRKKTAARSTIDPAPSARYNERSSSRPMLDEDVPHTSTTPVVALDSTTFVPIGARTPQHTSRCVVHGTLQYPLANSQTRIASAASYRALGDRPSGVGATGVGAPCISHDATPLHTVSMDSRSTNTDDAIIISLLQRGGLLGSASAYAVSNTSAAGAAQGCQHDPDESVHVANEA